MPIDLSPQAGFALRFDPDSLALETPALRWEKSARRRTQMETVLMTPEAVPPDTALYWMFALQSAGQQAAAFAESGLTFACVLLPPLRVGREFVKTQGHYHPPMPGSGIGYPEVYTHYYGQLYLLLQRRAGEEANRLDSCALVEMKPGRSVMIPPGYAHILINPSDKPALMGGLYHGGFKPNYAPIHEMAGAAYYLVDEAGRERAQANPRYEAAPPLQRLTDLQGTRFAPPDDTQPLWASFTAQPERYHFLWEAEAARQQFASGDQRL